jgi:hypothetical protein
MPLRSRILTFMSATLIGVCLASCAFPTVPDTEVRGNWVGTSAGGLTITMTLARNGSAVTGIGVQTDSGSSSSTALTITGAYGQHAVALTFKQPGVDDLIFTSADMTPDKMRGKFASGLAMTFDRQ